VYCNLFFILDVHGEFGLINVHLFDILSAILSRKVREKFRNFFSLECCNRACERSWIYFVSQP